MRSRHPFFLALTAAIAFPAASHALVINSETGANDTAPSGAADFGYGNVVRVFAQNFGDFYSTGVYLGNGWVISAYHVVADSAADGGFTFMSPGEVKVNGVPYDVDPASAFQLTTAGSPSTKADLAMFRLVGTAPSLPQVHISGSTPAFNTAVTMAGAGYNGSGGVVGPYTSGSFTYNGYSWNPTSNTIARFGTNNVSSSSDVLVDDTSGSFNFGTTIMATTNYKSGTGVAQAAAGDSGGGVFTQTGGGAWQLSGIMLDATALSGQPGTSSVYSTPYDPTGNFTDQTYFADLSKYASQINPLIPEPGAAGLLTAAAAILLGSRRRAARIF